VKFYFACCKAIEGTSMEEFGMYDESGKMHQINDAFHNIMLLLENEDAAAQDLTRKLHAIWAGIRRLFRQYRPKR
jgi:hypothetical protein